MTRQYIETHFDQILAYENVIEQRLTSDVCKEDLIAENEYNLVQCRLHQLDYILIDQTYTL